MIRSDIGDIKNTGGRWGGAITAAEFLHAFAEDTPWIHLDIAGLAWIEDKKPFIAKGPSGVAVRSILEWVRSYSGLTTAHRASPSTPSGAASRGAGTRRASNRDPGRFAFLYAILIEVCSPSGVITRQGGDSEQKFSIHINPSGGQTMILQTAELLPNHKAAIEEIVGRELQDRENIVLSQPNAPPACRTDKAAVKNALPVLSARPQPAPEVD